MVKGTLLLVLFMLGSIVAVGCTEEAKKETPVQKGSIGRPPVTTVAERQVKSQLTTSADNYAKAGVELSSLVEGNRQFAIDLYSRLTSGKETNVFFSPFSISVALAMTYSGASGQTGRQMADVLHFGMSETELHPAFARLRQALLSQSGQGCQLRVANRLWGQEGTEFLPPFLQTTRDHYAAELGMVDFAHRTEEGRQTINGWVEKETEQKIKELLSPTDLSPLTRLVLTNAIYFKGDWQSKFSKKETEDAPFHVSPGRDVIVPMMQQKGHFGYGVHDGLQVLELPYVGGRLSMFVLLPKDSQGLPDLEKKLTQKSLEQWTRVEHQEVRVFLPRFKLTCSFSLGDVLKSMGMTLAFKPGEADFSRMTRSDKLSISAVIHKAFVDVNEEGTEAAAATAVIMNLPGPPEPNFRADHPFVFLIRDNQTGSILFMGRAVNPKD